MANQHARPACHNLAAGRLGFSSQDPAKVTVSFLSESRMATHLLIHPRSAKLLGSTNADLDVAMVRIATPFTNLPYTAEPLIFDQGRRARPQLLQRSGVSVRPLRLPL